MIKLGRHIEILLLDNDCVIVPQFGGFTAHYVNAQCEVSTNFFYPPLRTLGFNPQLTINDSLLAQSYIEAYDISYPEAIRRIEGEVEELKQHLSEDGEYELEDIGVLSLNKEGNYEFEPCEAGLLSPELYALSSFEIKPLVRWQPVEVKQAAVEGQKVPVGGQKVKEATVHQAQILPLDVKREMDVKEETEREDTVVRIKLSTLRRVAAACIAAVLIAAFSLPIDFGTKSPLQNNQASALFYKIWPKTIVTNDAVGQKEEIVAEVAENKVVEAPVAKEESLAQVEKGCFTIVLASRISSKNATEYTAELHKKGYDQAQVLKRNKEVKVIYGSYQSKNEAYRTLGNLRSVSAFAEAWVMQVN